MGSAPAILAVARLDLAQLGEQVFSGRLVRRVRPINAEAETSLEGKPQPVLTLVPNGLDARVSADFGQ